MGRRLRRTITLGTLATLLGARLLMANGTDQTLETVTGVFLGPGVECVQLRLDDGEQISLTGAVPEAEEGTRMVLKGRWALVSYCMQGRSFSVVDGTIQE